MLLTSLECATREQCEHVAGIYRQRWQIEELHKCLKSGLKAEASQLRTWKALSVLLGFMLIVAALLLRLKWVAREDTWPHDLDRPDERLLAYLSHKTRCRLDRTSTPCAVLRAIAMLGGYLGRNNDPEPGWQTLWRGMQQAIAFQDAAQYIDTAAEPPGTCV